MPTIASKNRQPKIPETISKAALWGLIGFAWICWDCLGLLGLPVFVGLAWVCWACLGLLGLPVFAGVAWACLRPALIFEGDCQEEELFQKVGLPANQASIPPAPESK